MLSLRDGLPTKTAVCGLSVKEIVIDFLADHSLASCWFATECFGVTACLA
jgi:hypothetical protein